MDEFRQRLQGIFADQLDRALAGTHGVQILGSEDAYATVKNLHFHPTAELFVQVSGTSRMETVRGSVRCRAGQLMLVPRGVPHDEHVVAGREPFENIVVAFGRRTISIHEAREGTRGYPAIVSVEQFISEDVARLFGYLDMIAEWRRREANLGDAAIRGLLMAFFGLLLDNMQEPSMRHRDESSKVIQCRRMVSEHLANPDLGVRWLAERIVCAPDYLSHLFHQETGDKLTQYINDKRIAFASHLLEDSMLNIEQVAYACGYRDPGYMTRQFRRRAGCTPRGYRKGHRGTPA